MAVQPIPYYGPASTDGNGVLNCWVQQPVADAVRESKDGIYLTEKFKGPYSTGKSLLSRIKTGQTVSTVHSILHPLVSRHPSPGAPSRGDTPLIWLLSDINVEELKAGDHCMVTVRFFAGEDTTITGEEVEDPKQDVWTLSWQSYSVSPYAFCKNEQTQEYDGSQPNYDGLPKTSEGSSNRRLIEQFLQSDKKDSTHWCFPDPKCPGNVIPLQYADVLVMKKVLNNEHAVYHFPVLTHTTVAYRYVDSFSEVVSYSGSVGGKMDHIDEDALQNCPYGFSGDFDWVKVDDEMQQSKIQEGADVCKIVFTRKQSWWGVKNADVNFYGNTEFSPGQLETCRWEVGQV